MTRLTRKQSAIISAYTGYLAGDFSDMAEYAESLLGRPIMTHEYPSVSEELREASKADFLSICRKG